VLGEARLWANFFDQQLRPNFYSLPLYFSVLLFFLFPFKSCLVHQIQAAVHASEATPLHSCWIFLLEGYFSVLGLPCVSGINST